MSDLINILKDVRGTGAAGTIPTDGIYWDLTINPTDDDLSPRLGNGLYGSMLAMYTSTVPVINSVSDISNIIPFTGQISVVAGGITEVTTLAAITLELQSLYLDRIKLSSLYADKAILDSLYADKPTLDSLYADKLTLDSLLADKAKLDSIFSDKVTLDSLVTDKAVLDSLYADKLTLDRIFASITAVDTVALSTANIDIVSPHVASIDVVASSIADVSTVAGSLSDISFFASTYYGALAAEPTLVSHATLSEGDLYFDIGLKALRVYDGVNWSNSLTLTAASIATLTNKTINDISNEVAANIVHLEVQADAQTINPGDILEATNIVGDDIVKVQRHSSLGNPVVGIAIDTMSPGTNGRAMLTGVYNNYDSTGLALHTILYGDGTGGLTTTPTIVDGNYNQPIAYVQKINGANADLIVNIHSAHESASLISSNPAGKTYVTGTNVQAAVDQIDTKLIDLETTKAELGGSATQEFLVSTTPVSTNAATSKAYVDAQFVAGDSNVSLTETFEFLIGAAQVFPLDCGAPSSYIPSSTTCVVNGIVLDEADYTASDGQLLSFTGTNPTEGDLVKLVAYGGADVYTKTQSDARFADIAIEAEVAANTTKLLGIEAGATADQIASEVPFTPVGDIAATDVQSALVEIDTEKAPLASPALTGTPTINGVNVSGYTGFKNRIINGDFSVWQRGDVFSASENYTADRWGRDSRNPTITRVTVSGETFGGYALEQSGGTHQRIISQGIELFKLGDAGEFQQGKTYTLSFWFKNSNSSDLTTSVYFADGVASGTNLVSVSSKAHVISGNTWYKYSHSFTIGVSPIATNTCLKIQFTTADSSATTTIAQVQLEEGSVATPFEQRPIGLERIMCERYYRKYTSLNSAFVYNGYVISGSTYLYYVNFGTEMRVSPTVTNILSSASGFATNSASVNSSRKQGVRFQNTSNASANSGYYTLEFDASSEL